MRQTGFILLLAGFIVAGSNLEVFAQELPKQRIPEPGRKAMLLQRRGLRENLNQKRKQIFREMQQLREKEKMLRRALEEVRYRSKHRFSPELEKKVLSQLKKVNPERADRLAEVKSKNPPKYRDTILRIAFEQEKMKILKEKNPERFQQLQRKKDLQEKTRQLVEQYRATKDSQEKKNLKNQLRTVLNDLFDLRELDRQDEIKTLTRKLDELKAVMKKRRKNKPDIVERHLKELLGEAKEWIW